MDFTNREKEILRIFKLLIDNVGLTNLVVYGTEYNNDGQIYIYKKSDIWATYIFKKHNVVEQQNYDDLYDLCINVFTFFNKEKQNYCLYHFPKKFYFDAFNKENYSEEEDILSNIEEEIILRMKVKDVEEVRHVNTNTFPSTYDEYTLEEFVTIYKIIRLLKLNVITKDKYEQLMKLYKLERSILKYYGHLACERLLNDNEELTKKIDEYAILIKEIDNELNKYHLLDIKLNLSDSIDMTIKKENYNDEN